MTLIWVGFHIQGTSREDVMVSGHQLLETGLQAVARGQGTRYVSLNSHHLGKNWQDKATQG